MTRERIAWWVACAVVAWAIWHAIIFIARVALDIAYAGTL